MNYLILLILFFSLNLAQAFTVTKIGKSDLIFSLDDESVEPEEELFVLNKKNNKILVVQVVKVSAKNAKAKILRGNVKELAPGLKLVKKSSAPSSQQTSSEKSNSRWGLLGSLMLGTMNARFNYNNETQSTSMTGTSFGLLGYYDYTLNRTFDLRTQGGIEQFNVKKSMSTAVCDGGKSSECLVYVNYLSVYGLGKLKLTHSKNKFWIGGGLGFLMANSPVSTVLDTSQISSFQVFTIGAGMDMQLGDKHSLPLSIEYVQFPASSTVNSNFISIKAGYGFDL